MNQLKIDESKILVVDDNLEDLKVLRVMLEEQGHHVCTAKDGEEAIHLARRETPDLILLNYYLPEVNGYEVCQRLKADQEVSISDIPVIFLSAADKMVDYGEAFSAGGVDIINKPLQTEEIFARVGVHLSLCQSQKEIRELKAQVNPIQIVRTDTDITERRETEEQLRKLSRAVEQSGSTIMITDLEGTIEFVSPAFSKITGYSAQEAIGQNPRMLNSGETPPQVYERLWKTISQGEVWEGEFLNKKKNGDLYRESATISPVKNIDGQTTHYVAVKEDITKHRLVQESLKRQTRYYEALASCSQIIMQGPDDEKMMFEYINEALSLLVASANVGRAYVFRNIPDPQDGDYLGIVAEACSPGVPTSITNPVNRKYSWSAVSLEVHSSLKAGKTISGPVEQVFASNPSLVEQFMSQAPPLLSVLFAPIHFWDHWWGFIGFDDVVTARQWDQEEILMLRTASEMIGNTLKRWEIEAALQESHKQLEQKVKERTADLNQTVNQLRQEVIVRERTEREIIQQLAVEQKLAVISTRMMQTTNVQGIVAEIVGTIGDLTQAQRVYLFRFQDDHQRAEKSLEWCAPGVEPVLGDVHSLRGERLRGLVDMMCDEGSFYVPDVSALPTEVQEDLALNIQGGNMGNFVLPIYAEDDLAGFLISQGTDAYERHLQVLQVVVGMLGSLWQRERVIESLEERIADRTRELSTFFDLATLASGTHSLEELLQPAITRIVSSCHCDTLCIHLYSADGKKMELVAHYNLTKKEGELLQFVPLPEDYTHSAKEIREPLVTLNLGETTRLLPALRLPGYRTYLGAQIRTGDKVHGSLSCYRRSEEGFALDEISLLGALAEQLGVMIENHRLRQLTEEMVVVEERQRLARELHDSITQSLYSQTLFARTGRYAYEDGEELKLKESLSSLEENALVALKEMRLLLFQLQPQALENVGLAAAINKRMDMVERRLGIKATCQIDENIILPEDVEEIFYRIALEALNNSLKHAGADEVNVRLGIEQMSLVLEIFDNGGFDMGDTRGGMGMKSMSERAGQIGGDYEIDTAPGKGTIVRVIVANEDFGKELNNIG